jgi:hypothetical protein
MTLINHRSRPKRLAPTITAAVDHEAGTAETIAAKIRP